MYVVLYVCPTNIVLNLDKHISQMDDVNLTSEEYQRVYHYLSKFGSNDKINNYLPNDNIMNSSRKFFEVIQR